MSKDAAYCFVCSLFPEGPGRASADPAWVQRNNTLSKMKGSLGRNKKGKLVSHFTSESHQTAMMDFIGFISTSSHVDLQLNKGKRACLLAKEKLRQQNTEVITILLDVPRTLARERIAFRGDGDDKNGNFQQITHLVSRYNPALKNWLENKDAKSFHTSYMSGKSQNEFIHLLADAVHEDIATEVSHSEMFSVMADTRPEVSNKDQLTVAVRYLDADDKPTERLVQVKEV